MKDQLTKKTHLAKMQDYNREFNFFFNQQTQQPNLNPSSKQNIKIPKTTTTCSPST